MNQKQLFDQLTKIFSIRDDEIVYIGSLDETKKNALEPSTLTSFRIREILTDTTLNHEQKRNHLESFLINKIKTEVDTQKKNVYKFSLKLSLHSRGYYTGDLGRLEMQLFLLPCQDPLNPDIQFLNDFASIPLVWQHINAIRVELSNCLDKPESYCSKLEKLAQLIREILYKYQHLNPEPDTENIQLSIQKKNKEFFLNFIDKALNLINDAMVQTNENEWSLWTSAGLESLDYHKDLKSSSEVDEIEQCVHLDRSNYFLTLMKAFNDPICVHVKNQLSKYRHMNLSELSESSLDTVSMIEAIKNKEISVETTLQLSVIEKSFLEAYQLLCADKKQTDFVNRALQCAIILDNNCSSLGTFVRTTACVLAEPLSLKQWTSHFETLQCIAIPKRWRSQISDIWLKLTEFFIERYSETNIFYKDAAIACIDQISDRSIVGNVDEISDIKELSELIIRIKQGERKYLSSNDDTPHYSMQAQYQLTKYLLQISTDDFDKIATDNLDIIISELLNSENPYCLAEIVRMLCTDSVLKERASSAVQKKYSHDLIDPRFFCEQVLQKTVFNKYLIIFGPLICSTALHKRYLPVEILAEERDISDTMLYKLCTQVRQQLRGVLLDQNETAIVVPCGFSYLKVLEKKLYDLTSRLMSSGTSNSLYDALCFTNKRQGLREAVYALLFFYDGNYYAAQQMAILSVKPNSNTGEYKPQKKSITTSLSSVIGTPIHGSPERPRKLSPRLVVTALKKFTPDSSEASPSSNESHTQHSSLASPLLSSTKTVPPLKIPRDSDPSASSSTGRATSPVFQLSPTGSSNGSMDLSISNSKSPRARSFTNGKTSRASLLSISSAQNNHTPLGHLINAMIIWETRLKNNNKRLLTDVSSFQSELTDTQDFSIPEEERNFITGMRWLYYLMSYNPFSRKRDKLWLLEGDESLYKKTKTGVKKDLKRMSQLSKNTEGTLSEYTVFKIAKHYFYNKQTRVNPNTKKFPPAILIIFQFLISYMDKYPPTEPDLILKEREELARLLKNTVFINGYFPAVPTYLSCYSLAHPSSLEQSEIITTGLTPLDRITLIKNALLYSELYSPFPINSLATTEQLKIIEADEQQKLMATKPWTVEVFKPFDHKFKCSPIKVNCGGSIITMNFNKNIESYVWQCQFLNNDEAESSFVNDFESLQQQFQRAANIYSYCKKVDLPHDRIIFRQENSLIINHADIAIIGLIFLAEGKLSIILAQSELLTLLELLNEAKSLKKTTWQWEGTHARLQNFVPRFQDSNTDASHKDLDEDELRIKLSPLSPSQEPIGSPRGHLSPVSFSPRQSSLMLVSPRRSSHTDNLTYSLPSSPRGQATNSSNRDSGKVIIPDGSPGSIPIIRTRSTTDASKYKNK